MDYKWVAFGDGTAFNDNPATHGFLGKHVWEFGGSIPAIEFVVEDCIIDTPNLVVWTECLKLGSKQKIANAAAIQRDTTTGKSATNAEKRAAMQVVVDRLLAGAWNAETREKKPAIVDVDALVAAIAATINKSVVGVRQFVEAKPEDGRRKLAESKEFAAAYAIALAQKRPVTELGEDDSAELDALPDDVE